MADKSTLTFLNNEAGEEEGLNDAGVETFKDTPYASVARECGQNSIDAMSSRPVVMRFDLLKVPRKKFPCLPDFEQVISACHKKAVNKKDEKVIDFFRRAGQVLQSEHISVLRISDENTQGLVGPCVEGKPFHSLVKSTGISNKGSDTSAGSFGIGKNAAFACSELRTVFYSTIFKSEDGHFLAQGKSLLISHNDSQGKPKRARGYWGGKDFLPLNNPTDIPDWMVRESVGTSVFCAGFVVSPHWSHSMAASILRNFFCALEAGDIEFVLNDGEVTIDRSTTKLLFRDPKIREAARESNQIEDLDISRDLHECLTSNESVRRTLTIGGLGKIEIRILLREDLPKKVYVVRNGMLICDSLKNFGEKFQSFPMYKDFVAVVQTLDNEGSALIKTLENPRHDELSAERIPDTGKRNVAIRAMTLLAKAVRTAIREEAVIKPDNLTTLDELSEFFSDKKENDAPPSPDAEENPEKLIYKVQPLSTKTKEAPGTSTGGDQGGAGGAGGKRPGSGGGIGVGTGSGTGGKGVKANGKPIVLLETRNVLTTNEKGQSVGRRIFFTPSVTGKIIVSISAAGLQASDALSVSNTNDGKIAGGSIEIEVEAGKRKSIAICLSEPYVGPIEIQAFSGQIGAPT